MNDENASPQESSGGRHPLVAILLSFVAPGLGLIYVGRLLAGLVINLLFVLLALFFVIAASLLQFFPLYPALVLGATWLLFCVLSGWRAVEIIRESNPRRTRAYQHPLLYTLIALVTFLAPLAMTVHFTSRHLLTVVPVEDTSMYPHTHPGDRLLIDRTEYHNAAPKRGDLVAIRHPLTDELAVLRVIGIPTDVVEVHGYTLRINDEPVDSLPLRDFEQLPQWFVGDEVTELWVENIYDRQYVTSIVSGAGVNNPFVEVHVGEEQYFVLADNRSHAENSDGAPDFTDSRIFGAISRDQIEGRPMYVAWSSTPNSGSPRWDRIGLPVQ